MYGRNSIKNKDVLKWFDFDSNRFHFVLNRASSLIIFIKNAMITSLLNFSMNRKGLSILIEKTHPKFITVILENKKSTIKFYDLYINENRLTISPFKTTVVDTHRIETRHLKEGKNLIKVIARNAQGLQEIYEELFFYNSSLKIRKVASGVSFDVFQWKRPKNSNNKYKINFNGKEYVKTSQSNIVLESIPLSKFIEGKNTIEVEAFTINSRDKKIVEKFDFRYNFKT